MNTMSLIKKLFSCDGDSSGCCCCGSRVVDVRKIDVGGSIVRINDLDETLQRYFEIGKTPEDLNGDELLEELGKTNYITEAKKDAYREAFLREYRSYYQDKKR